MDASQQGRMIRRDPLAVVINRLGIPSLLCSWQQCSLVLLCAADDDAVAVVGNQKGRQENPKLQPELMDVVAEG